MPGNGVQLRIVHSPARKVRRFQPFPQWVLRQRHPLFKDPQSSIRSKVFFIHINHQILKRTEKQLGIVRAHVTTPQFREQGVVRRATNDWLGRRLPAPPPQSLPSPASRAAKQPVQHKRRKRTKLLRIFCSRPQSLVFCDFATIAITRPHICCAYHRQIHPRHPSR